MGDSDRIREIQEAVNEALLGTPVFRADIDSTIEALVATKWPGATVGEIQRSHDGRVLFVRVIPPLDSIEVTVKGMDP